MSNLVLIVKPTQSGKTFVMLYEIKKMLDYNENNIHIIFCDNQLLQTEQLSNRLEKFGELEKYTTEDGNISVILSSKSKIKNDKDLTDPIIFDKIKTIVTCSNTTRIEHINNLIDKFTSSVDTQHYKFCIWIDEIDKNIKTFVDDLKKWEKNKNIIKIGLITATPEEVFEYYKDINIFRLDNTFDKDKYHSFSDSNIQILNCGYNNGEIYIRKILEKYNDAIKIGQVWFVPGETNIESHSKIKDIFIEKDFVVMVINGNEKRIYYDKTKFENISCVDELKSLSEVLGDLYITPFDI